MLLELSEVDTYYGTSQALRKISLTIRRGEVVSLLGRNGMGKSTTLKSIMGLLKPRNGKIIFNNQEITGYRPYKVARAGIGYVPEERRIFPTLSVMENLLMGTKTTRSINSSKHQWTISRIYNHFPFMKERSKQKGAHLSGGEQQMLTIARALMGNPELLLVDEPTEGLSPIMVNEIRMVLENISRDGISILLVEHNLKLALSISTRVYLMGKGYVGYSGTAQELQSSPEVKAQYLEV